MLAGMSSEPNTLSDDARLMLGAFAFADAHTLTPAEVNAMSSGAVASSTAGAALEELRAAGFAEPDPSGEGFRLNRPGIELALQLQASLLQKG